MSIWPPQTRQRFGVVHCWNGIHKTSLKYWLYFSAALLLNKVKTSDLWSVYIQPWFVHKLQILFACVNHLDRSTACLMRDGSIWPLVRLWEWTKYCSNEWFSKGSSAMLQDEIITKAGYYTSLYCFIEQLLTAAKNKTKTWCWNVRLSGTVLSSHCHMISYP